MTHGLELVDQRLVEVVPEPPDISLGRTPEEEAGRRLAARLVHGDEAALVVLGEERADVQTHQFLRNPREDRHESPGLTDLGPGGRPAWSAGPRWASLTAP